MKVLKSTILKKRKCEFGNFELAPETGWKISQTFIDHESRLLVVSVSDENERNWTSGGGMRQIPNKQFIIDSKKAIILKHTEWNQYFNYNTIESFSEDKKLKLLTTRIHEPERNTDGIKEELIQIETGKTISTSNGVAFRDAKRTTLIDSYYESIERAKNYKKQLELGVYPEPLKNKNLQSLESGSQVLEYYDEEYVYKLTFDNNSFILGKASRPKSIEEWDNYQVESLNEFTIINEFWNYLSKEDNWFEFLKPRKTHPSLHYYIITWHNDLIHGNELTYSSHKAIHEWMNQCWDDSLNRNVYWQFCSNCKTRVLYGPRYPKHACGKCVDLIKDENGDDLDYKDRHELKYIDGEFQVVLKDSDRSVKLFIGLDEYWASEARFGGIVHQKKENKHNKV
jgi:hypothetical protein